MFIINISVEINMVVSSCLLPIGSVFSYAGDSVPDGCLFCDGSAISRTTYKRLFSVIGTYYGTGDGSSTFNIPDLREKYIFGKANNNTVGTVYSSGLPNISGTATLANSKIIISPKNVSGCFYALTERSGGVNESINYETNSDIGFSASKSNTIYGSSTFVRPPSIVMLFCIKFG